jgi:hypothetical protein
MEETNYTEGSAAVEGDLASSLNTNERNFGGYIAGGNDE